MSGLVVPGELVETTVRWNGERGRRWIDELPATVSEFARRWDLRIGDVYEPGACALVVRAERAGEPVVLKLSGIDDETRGEADALRYWAGDGAVRLLDADAARGVLLLERLEPGTPLGDHADRDSAISIACGLLLQLWRSPPADHRLPLAHELAASWLAELPDENERLGRPLPPTVIDAAAEVARELAQPPSTIVIANRDFHLFNVLAAQRAPWLLIDPKPLAGEPAFDTGYFVADLVATIPGRPRWRVLHAVSLRTSTWRSLGSAPGPCSVPSTTRSGTFGSARRPPSRCPLPTRSRRSAEPTAGRRPGPATAWTATRR